MTSEMTEVRRRVDDGPAHARPGPGSPPPDGTHGRQVGVGLLRSAKARVFARLPQTRIEHQRLEAFLEESQKTQAQSDAGQRRTRDQSPRIAAAW